MGFVHEFAEWIADADVRLVWSETAAGGNVIAAGVMPDQPDLAVRVVTTGSAEPELRLSQDAPRVQVTVRAPAGTPRPGVEVADAIFGFVHGAGRAGPILLSEGTVVRLARARHDTPVAIGADSAGREAWTLNFDVLVDPAATTLYRSAT